MKRGGPLARRTPLRRGSSKPKATGGKKRRTLEEMSHSELEARLDDEVSFFVRATPAIYNQRGGMVQCVTCGRWHYWKDLDCGHYIPRHRQGTRYDLRNVRPQCTQCNSWHEGEHWKFRQVLVAEIGEREVQAIELLASMWGSDRHSRGWLILEIEKWRERNKPLKKAIKELEEGR